MDKRRRKIQCATSMSAISKPFEYHDLGMCILKGMWTLTDAEVNINARKYIEILKITFGTF